MPSKSSFLDKVLGRIGRLDTHGLQTVVQRLARERSFLETLFNAIEDGILVVDEQARIIYYNQAATDLLGLPAQTAEGQLASKYLPELDWKKWVSVDQAGGQHVARHEFEVTYPRPRFLSLYLAPLDGEATGSSGLALVIHDATEAREKTYAAIDSERVQALTLLAASVAHEIGNPLNALHIHLQLMERELRKLRQALAGRTAKPRGPLRSKKTGTVEMVADTTEVVQKLEKYLGVSKGEITRLDYIVTQFLHAIRPAPPKFTQVALNDVVRETIELLRPEIENRGLVVREKLARRLPLVSLDAGQVQQALVNLIKNAIQAMTTHGVLTLETGSSHEGIWVSVADTGHGIPQDQINRIFEPFYTTKSKGSGLGLMIVQRIVRAHAGRMDLESQLHQGTTFRLWFPIQERSPRLLEAGTSPTHD